MGKRKTMLILLIAGLATMIGCDGDRRLAEVATEAARCQAGQNEEMIRLNREVAANNRQAFCALRSASARQFCRSGGAYVARAASMGRAPMTFRPIPCRRSRFQEFAVAELG